MGKGHYLSKPEASMYDTAIGLARLNSVLFTVILCLHYVPGGHCSHVSDSRDENGITMRQRRGTG